MNYPKSVERALVYSPLSQIDTSYSPFAMVNHELTLTAFAAHRMNKIRVKRSTVEAHILYKGAGLPVPVPTGRLKITVKSTVNQPNPYAKLQYPDKKIPLQTIINNNLWKNSKAVREGNTLTIRTPKGLFILCPRGGQNLLRAAPPPVTTVHMQVENPVEKEKIQVTLPQNQTQNEAKEVKSEEINGTEPATNGKYRMRQYHESKVLHNCFITVL